MWLLRAVGIGDRSSRYHSRLRRIGQLGGLKLLVFQEKKRLIYGKILVVKELMYVRIVVLKNTFISKGF